MSTKKKPTMAPRKAPDPVALDAFIHGRPPEPPPPPPPVPEPAKAAPKKDSKKRRDEAGERVTAYLPPELEAEFRVFCAREKRSVSDAVTEAVRLLLQRHEATKG